MDDLRDAAVAAGMDVSVHHATTKPALAITEYGVGAALPISAAAYDEIVAAVEAIGEGDRVTTVAGELVPVTTRDGIWMGRIVLVRAPEPNE